MTKISDNDPDRAKGATESAEHHHDGNLAISEQLGHRDQDAMIKGGDTDFPEPDAGPEHSGETATKLTARLKSRPFKANLALEV